MSKYDESPIVDKMGPTVFTIFERVNGTLYEVKEYRDKKKAKRKLRSLRKLNANNQYILRAEEMPNLARLVPVRKIKG